MVIGLMAEFITAFFQMSFCMSCEMVVGIPAVVNAWAMWCDTSGAVGVMGPMMVRPMPVCLMVPGLVDMAPWVVMPARMRLGGIVQVIVSIFPSPFWRVRICFALFRMGWVKWIRFCVSYALTVIMARSGFDGSVVMVSVASRV